MSISFSLAVAVRGTLATRIWEKGAVRPCPFFLAVYYGVILLLVPAPRLEQASAFSLPLTTTTTTPQLLAPVSPIIDDNKKTTKTTRTQDGPQPPLSRRDVLKGAKGTAFALPAILAAMTERPQQACAAESSAAETATETKMNSYKILRKMRSVPTFCLVTQEGIPFMVLEDDKTTASGYFFLSYETASGNLRSARQKEQQDKGQISNVCADAKIIIVPLGVALQLALSQNQSREVVNLNNSISNNNEGPSLLLSTHHEIIVSTEGRDDANEVENRSVADVATTTGGTNNTNNSKERVPLFYLEGLTLANGKEPRYFNELDLWHEWNRQHPHQPRPPTHLVELLELYGTALTLDDNTSNNSNTTNAHNNTAAAFARVANVTLMPVADTVQVGKDLMKTAIPPNYNFQQLYLLGGPPPSTTTVTTITAISYLAS